MLAFFGRRYPRPWCVHSIFGIVAIAIIRNVCTHKMCYGLLFSTLSVYRLNAMVWY